MIQTQSYNSRLQTYAFAVANTSNQSTYLSATLNWGVSQSSPYPTDPANDNGNLGNATFVNSGPSYATPLTFTQNYTYDAVNRLKAASDTGGWSRTFSYDAFGNT